MFHVGKREGERKTRSMPNECWRPIIVLRVNFFFMVSQWSQTTSQSFFGSRKKLKAPKLINPFVLWLHGLQMTFFLERWYEKLGRTSNHGLQLVQNFKEWPKNGTILSLETFSRGKDQSWLGLKGFSKAWIKNLVFSYKG